MSRTGALAWLELWERAASSPPRGRRRELLTAAGSPGGRAPEQLEIGRANAQLLRLHTAMFGLRLACSTTCPACGEELELELDAEEILAQERVAPAEPAQLQVGKWDVSFRLPTEADVDAVQGERDVAVARDTLLQRCVITCRRGQEATSISLAPPEVAAGISARMEEYDPLAALDFGLQCGSCGHAWSSALEVDSFLWARLDAWVRRLLGEVHAIAKVYGWSEESIAAMSPWKRQIYLDLVDG